MVPVFILLVAIIMVMVVTANVGFRVYGYTGCSGNGQSKVQSVCLQW